MGAGSVSALAGNLEGEIIFAGGHTPYPGMQGTGRQERSVVETVDFLDGKTLEQPVVKHGLGAVPRFFSRLENETDGAVEIFPFTEELGGSQESDGVAIVAAAVHFARILGHVVVLAALLDVQGVHIGPDADAAGAVPYFQGTYHAGAANALCYVNAHSPHFLGHQFGGGLFLKGGFRMLMEVMPPGNQLITKRKLVVWHRIKSFHSRYKTQFSSFFLRGSAVFS